MRRKVSLVVKIIDDLTSRLVTGYGIECQIPGEKPPVWKSGYAIFTDLEEGHYQVIISSENYQRNEITVFVTAQSKEPVYKKIRVTPGKEYKGRDQMVEVSGKAGAGTELILYGTSLSKPYRLLTDYRKEEHHYLELHHREEIDLSGKAFFIQAKEKNQVFLLGCKEDEDSNRYQLEHPLMESYKKTETEIYPAFSAMCNSQGKFFCLLPREQTSVFEISVYLDGMDGTKIEKKLSVKSGENNYFDFSKEE